MRLICHQCGIRCFHCSQCLIPHQIEIIDVEDLRLIIPLVFVFILADRCQRPGDHVLVRSRAEERERVNVVTLAHVEVCQHVLHCSCARGTEAAEQLRCHIVGFDEPDRPNIL